MTKCLLNSCLFWALLLWFLLSYPLLCRHLLGWQVINIGMVNNTFLVLLLSSPLVVSFVYLYHIAENLCTVLFWFQNLSRLPKSILRLLETIIPVTKSLSLSRLMFKLTFSRLFFSHYVEFAGSYWADALYWDAI